MTSLKTPQNVVAIAVASMFLAGIAQAQTTNHAGHGHSGHDHSAHQHSDVVTPIDGEPLQLSMAEQSEMGLVLEQVEMRDLSEGQGAAIALPRDSIVARDGKFYVIILDEQDTSKFTRVEVILGKSDQNYVDASSGVFPGDTVVANAAEKVGATAGHAQHEAEPGAACELFTPQHKRYTCPFESNTETRAGDFDCPLDTANQHSRKRGCSFEARRFR